MAKENNHNNLNSKLLTLAASLVVTLVGVFFYSLSALSGSWKNLPGVGGLLFIVIGALGIIYSIKLFISKN
ncbi:MAG: hypothetical protein AABW73_00825 [Nanoarchaeota archaeon]